ncbi:MAG: M14 family metallopeptidase [Cyclobacteriaceae bacterium]
MRYLLILSLLVLGCSQQPALPVFEFPQPFDTSDKIIATQEKKVFDNDSLVQADNLFDGARLNGFERLNDSIFQVSILPENEPINSSPWYAFRILSSMNKDIYLSFNYGKYLHRYYPKLSKDGKVWLNADSLAVINDEEGTFEYLRVSLEANRPLWVAGQEIITSSDVRQWADKITLNEATKLEVIGKSKLGKDLFVLDIDEGTLTAKPMLVVLSRQHPPEVTGYQAMEYFVDELLKNEELSVSFRDRFRVLVFPILNPDGVDMGHWRHGAGGVDLNRDWAAYMQPEVSLVARHIFNESKENKVVFGVDFHSTYKDVFYTNDTLSAYPDIRQQVFASMERQIDNYKVNEKPSAVTKPVSKSWFYSAFKAEGITYEVGDSTPEEVIELKGRAAARGVMQALLDSVE